MSRVSKRLLSTITYSKCNFSSALYITGDKAQKNFAVLTPVIDFDKQLNNKDDLAKNICHRQLDIDLEKLEKLWRFFQFINYRKELLEHTKTELGNVIQKLMNNSEENQENIEKLKLHVKIVKDDLKNIKTYYYGVEEMTMLKVLDLPNILHKKTPIETDVILHSHFDLVNKKTASHLEIAKDKGYIKYVDSYTCYLKSEAALFEVGILNYFRKRLLDSKYTPFSNPNFCKSVIVEGCGVVNSKIFKIEEKDRTDSVNRLHFCGSSTLFPFMAYFSRHLVNQNCFPMKYFCLGKSYRPISEPQRSLFYLNQQTTLNVFVASSEDEDLLEMLIQETISFYKDLGYHFRLKLLSANQLDSSESIRVSIQMYSNCLGKYIEVGNLSSYENFLSKRLLFTYIDQKERKYAKVISGTLVNVPVLLGCVLENNSVESKDLLTNLLQNHLFL